MSVVCTLCGVSSEMVRLLGGHNGYLCFRCLGEALSAVSLSIGKPGERKEPKSRPDASHRCLICNNLDTSRNLVAFRRPFSLCDECLLEGFRCALHRVGGDLAIVEF